jgi:hypothetical protein
MRNPLTSDQRYREARSIDRLLMDASRPRRAGTLVYLPVHQRSVVLACAEPLVEIAAVLRDPARVVGDALGRRIATFLRDGSTSPLFGSDAGRARLAASELAAAVANAPWRPTRVVRYPVIAVPRAG